MKIVLPSDAMQEQAKESYPAYVAWSELEGSISEALKRVYPVAERKRLEREIELRLSAVGRPEWSSAQKVCFIDLTLKAAFKEAFAASSPIGG